jgi:transcriptional antiterminator RfaH
VAYWSVAQLEPRRDRLALYCLQLAGFTTYQPRLRELKRERETVSALFPGYAFVLIALQWHAARWSPGITRLIMDGMRPARVPDNVIEAIRAREQNGIIELPRRLIRPGDRVRRLAGPFQGHLAIYTGMTGSERVAVLLQILGGEQRVTLARRDIEAVT